MGAPLLGADYHVLARVPGLVVRSSDATAPHHDPSAGPRDSSVSEGRHDLRQKELATKEKAVRAGTERLISAIAGSRPVPSLNFGEVREAALPSLTSRQTVRHAAQLTVILIDKILSTIESNC
jgi:hypothetical protein